MTYDPNDTPAAQFERLRRQRLRAIAPAGEAGPVVALCATRTVGNCRRSSMDLELRRHLRCGRPYPGFRSEPRAERYQYEIGTGRQHEFDIRR